MSNPYEKRIIRVLDYIHDNPAGDLSLDNLADVAAMSRFHWHRVFHGMTGETCAQAVRRIRLFRAACWLVQTEWPVAEIAGRVGYANLASFNRAFAVGFGRTPVAFRKRRQLMGLSPISKKENKMMFDVEITKAEPLRLAATDHKGAYIGIGQAFERLAAIAGSRNLWPEVKGMAGIYYDDPNAVAEADLRSQAGLAIGPETALPEGLEEVTIAGGKIARLRFKGPYAGLTAAYDHLFGTWLPESGQEPKDQPCYEVYLNSPADTAAEELLTDICVPLA